MHEERIPDSRLDRRRRGHRRHQRDDRPLSALPPPRHPAVRGGPGELGVLPVVCAGPARRRTGASSRIEGIGRPRVEPSFLPDVIDRMMVVPDAASVAAAHHVSAVLGRKVGPSTGTNVWGAFGLLAEMIAEGRSGSVVTLLADSGDRYADTYFDDGVADQPAGWTRRSRRRCSTNSSARAAGSDRRSGTTPRPKRSEVSEQPQRGDGEQSEVDRGSQPGHVNASPRVDRSNSLVTTPPTANSIPRDVDPCHCLPIGAASNRGRLTPRRRDADQAFGFRLARCDTLARLYAGYGAAW